jgi:hypothetical protein
VIQLLRRLVRKIRHQCIDCSESVEQGELRCLPCFSVHYEDFDVDELLNIPVEGPIYFDDVLDQPKIGSAASKF